MTLPPGLTVAEIVAAALPGATPADRDYARVTLVSEHGSAMILPERWHVVRPREGVLVVVRLIPGKDALRAILSVVVSIAAVALGQVWAAGLGFTAGTTGFAVASSLIGMGVPLIGGVRFGGILSRS